MAALSLHVLPKTVSDESRWEDFVKRTKPLRLQSLKNDPKSFVSKYDSEVKEPLSFWVGRLKDPKAWTVVMVSSPEEIGNDVDALLRDDVEWVAFCVMVDPSVGSEVRAITETTSFDPANHTQTDGDRTEGKGLADWFMAAVWLSPELRGKGAGKRLVQCGIDTARKADAERGFTGRYCMTQVVKGNEGAIELYKKVGFELTDSDSFVEKDEVKHHSYELRMAL
jgi:ribosomal protein S18 acetylase RimI-like enzyme